MYASPNSSAREVGRIGLKYKALKVEKDWAKVRSGQIVGWVQLPTYTLQPVEPIHFAGAMIRIFRADWQGAYDMFEQVLKMPNISKSLKIDALLLQARALEEVRKDGSSKLNEVFTLSPYSETVVKYRLMKMLGQISDAMKPISDQSKALLIRRINLLLKEKAYLFPPEDPFIIELRKYIMEIENR